MLRKWCEVVTRQLLHGTVWVPWAYPVIGASGLAEDDVVQEQEHEGGMQEVLKADNAFLSGEAWRTSVIGFNQRPGK